MKGYKTTVFIKDDEEKDRLFLRGESFEIPKGLPFYIVAEPSAVLYVVSEPPWNDDQSRLVTFK